MCAVLIGLLACSKRTYHVVNAIMEPTIPAASNVVVDTTAYDTQGPMRWDVVAFEPPGSIFPEAGAPDKVEATWIMRVVALPGETIDFGGEEILVNDNRLEAPEPLAMLNYKGLGSQKDRRIEKTRYTLERDEYFLLGDDSVNSYDSRFWGPVKSKAIVGRLHEIIGK